MRAFLRAISQFLAPNALLADAEFGARTLDLPDIRQRWINQRGRPSLLFWLAFFIFAALVASMGFLIGWSPWVTYALVTFAVVGMFMASVVATAIGRAEMRTLKGE